MFKKKIFLLVLTGIFTVSVFSASPFVDEVPSAGDISDDDFDDVVWVEESYQLPAYPKEAAWHEIQSTVESRRFRYFIDVSSLSVGQSDGVVRYVIKVESVTGAKNIAYEAIRCTSIEYKVLAYGQRGQRFRSVKTPEWREMIKGGAGRYRYDLMDDYFCTVGVEKSKDEIIHAIKYPGAGSQSDFIDGEMSLY